MTVLILTRSDDSYVPELVAAALTQRGCDDVVRVDTDRFPDDIRLEDRGRSQVLTVDGRRIDSADVTAAWRRRCCPGMRIGSDPRTARAAAAQAHAAFDGWLAALPYVVNDPHLERRADHKARQLHSAHAVGLRVPDTLISNDASVVRRFVDDAHNTNTRVVTKLLAPLSATMDGSGPFVYTTTLTDDDVEHLDDVAWAPQIFQRRIEKTHDVRVQIIGDTVVAGAVACTSDDWRNDSSGAFSAWTLPHDVENACRAYVRCAQLVTSAIDLVVDQQGVHWFLENNPAGEWGFLERDLGRGLHHTLAACLLGAA